ncbi:unnamed protein product [Heligmosomoides polygyrus]|uniref:Transposase n=1 Tax=Heligmosomoides polygyrus TaxID=6339 RepID=A0A183F781_HELPZ|nr:unnamed protein product [Heligmosomoides polygyrus]
MTRLTISKLTNFHIETEGSKMLTVFRNLSRVARLTALVIANVCGERAAIKGVHNQLERDNISPDSLRRLRQVSAACRPQCERPGSHPKLP